MVDEPSDVTPPDRVESSGREEVDPADLESEFAGSSAGIAPASLAVDIAKIWVQEHQKASMLGAFAVGVFVGAMLRD